MPNSKRTEFNNEKLKNALEIFKDIVSCLEDIIVEPDDGTGKPMNHVCLEHNINNCRLRNLMETTAFHKIYIDHIVHPEDVEIPEDNYEKFYKYILEISQNEVVEYPVDLKETIDYALSNFLNEREQTMVKLRFGLIENHTTTSCKELSEIYNITDSRIGDIISHALKKITRYSHRMKLIRDGRLKFEVDKAQIESEQAKVREELERQLKSCQSN